MNGLDRSDTSDNCADNCDTPITGAASGMREVRAMQEAWFCLWMKGDLLEEGSNYGVDNVTSSPSSRPSSCHCPYMRLSLVLVMNLSSLRSNSSGWYL